MCCCRCHTVTILALRLHIGVTVALFQGLCQDLGHCRGADPGAHLCLSFSCGCINLCLYSNNSNSHYILLSYVTGAVKVVV